MMKEMTLKNSKTLNCQSKEDRVKLQIWQVPQRMRSQ